MKKRDVQLGKVYIAKVSGNLVRVRIDDENPIGGWDGTNLATGRSIRIRTAARLRHEADKRPQAGARAALAARLAQVPHAAPQAPQKAVQAPSHGDELPPGFEEWPTLSRAAGVP